MRTLSYIWSRSAEDISLKAAIGHFTMFDLHSKTGQRVAMNYTILIGNLILPRISALIISLGYSATCNQLR